jgi:hypothetical protein
VAVELNGLAAIDLTGPMNIGDFADLRVNTAEWAPTEEVLEDEAVVQRLHQRRQVKKGFRGGTLNLGGYLVPLAAELNSSATPTADSLSKTLSTLLGEGLVSAAGDAVQAAPSPTASTFTVADGSRFTPGAWIAVETSATSERFEPVLVKGVSTNAITLAWELSFTPVTNAKVLNFESYGPTQGLPSATKSLQVLGEGEGRDHSIYLAMGCQGPLSIEWTLGQLPTWSAQLAAMTFLTDTELAASPAISDAALAVGITPGGTPVPVTDGAIILSPISGALRTLPDIAECTWSLGVTWQAEPSYNGVEGKAQMVMVRGERNTCSMLVRAVDESWLSAWNAGTKYRIAAYAGNTGGGMVAMAFGTAELVQRPVLESPNGIDYWRLVWGALENQDVNSTTDEISVAPFVIGRG